MFNFIKISLKLLFIIIFFFISIYEIRYYTNIGTFRNLTIGEKKFLKEIFLDKIKYDKVKIFNTKFLPYPFQEDDVAMSPNGNIYFSKDYFIDDFSHTSFLNQSWLVHEMMHVYQYNTRGQTFSWEGAWLILKSAILEYDPYLYKIDFSRKFSDYNIEQQGDIAQDYFLHLHNQKNLSIKEVSWYKRILNLK